MRFDWVSSVSQIIFKEFELSNGEYSFDGEANLLFSYSPFDLFKFEAVASLSEGVSLLNLRISNFTCTGPCLLIGSPEGGLTISGLALWNILVQSSSSSLIEISTSFQAQDITLDNVHFTDNSSVLFNIPLTLDFRSYDVSFSSVSISNSTLPLVLLKSQAPITLEINDFHISSSLYQNTD